MEQENKNIQPENENKNVPTANYKKLYEEQTANLNDAQDCVSNLQKENEELQAKLEKTEEELKQKNKYYLQYYRQAEILKKALKALMESNNMKLGDMYEVLLESNSIDLDSLLMNLSK